MASMVGDNRVEKQDGTTVIAATRRADGTIRKERKVKPGYVPQDEIQAYDAAKKIAKKRGHTIRQGPVGMYAPQSGRRGATGPVGMTSSSSSSSNSVKTKTKMQRKNESRKKRKEEAAVAAAAAAAAAHEAAVKAAFASTSSEKPKETEKGMLEKNIRKLKKKLRQIAELEGSEEELTDVQQKKLNTKGTLLQRLAIAETSFQSL